MRQAAQTLREMVISAERTRLLTAIWIGPDLEAHGWRVFRQFNDHDFSFYDCTSIAICRQNGIESVFGFDSDFRIAGLDLRPGP
jgi:predicted nucleic acid-binding protein